MIAQWPMKSRYYIISFDEYLSFSLYHYVTFCVPIQSFKDYLGLSCTDAISYVPALAFMFIPWHPSQPHSSKAPTDRLPAPIMVCVFIILQCPLYTNWYRLFRICVRMLVNQPTEVDVVVISGSKVLGRGQTPETRA